MQYIREEVASDYDYPAGWALKPIADQARSLVGYFPGIDISHVDAAAQRYMKDDQLLLPQGMDGLAVIPRFAALAAFSQKHQDWPVYNRAMFFFLSVLKRFRKDFVDGTEWGVGPTAQKLHKQTTRCFAELEAETPGDVLVIPVQTGRRHRGKSIYRALHTFGEHEFGLDALSVGIIALLHPERLTQNDLWIDCPGTESSPWALNRFVDSVSWIFTAGSLAIGPEEMSNGNPHRGSASAVLVK